MQVKVKLKEGRKYPFKITGIIDLPDGNEYFVLKDPNSVKHLLLTSYYKKFNFNLGQTIQCRIDKINCSGKIFLEPEHPFYQPGKKYKFPFKFVEDFKDSLGQVYQFAVFTDVFDNDIKMPADILPEKIKPGDEVKFSISRIKKGRVYLTSNGRKEDYDHFKEGVYYYFRIVQFRSYPDKRGFYILKADPERFREGFNYKLKSKYYKKYNFKIGQSILCRLVRDGKKAYLEPKHPYYAIGKEYEFDIIGEELIDDYPSGKIETYLLRNDYGKSVHIQKKLVKGSIRNGKIKCKVTDIRKSRLYLEC